MPLPYLNSITDKPLPSGFSIFKRLINFLLAVSLAFILLYLWLNNIIQDQQQIQRQVNQLGDTLTTQHAKLLTASLQKKDLPAIQHQLTTLASDIHVHSSALFDEKGQLIVPQLEEQPQIVALFSEPQSNDLLVYVREVYQQGKTIGYLRILLKRDQVMQYYAAYREEVLFQTQLLIVLALLIGILATRGYYKLRYKLR